MPAKNPKDVKKSREQKGFAVLTGRKLNPKYRKEYEKALSKFKTDRKDLEANIEAFKRCISLFPKKWEGKVPTIEDAFLISPEGQALQKKYGTSIPITTENINLLPDNIGDIVPLCLLENGGCAVFLDHDSLNDNYLTIHIDLRRLSTDIIAELQEILREVKKSHRYPKDVVTPTPLEFKIYELWKLEGKKPTEIMEELSNENWPGGSERSRFDTIKKAKTKVQKWIKLTEQKGADSKA